MSEVKGRYEIVKIIVFILCAIGIYVLSSSITQNVLFDDIGLIKEGLLYTFYKVFCAILFVGWLATGYLIANLLKLFPFFKEKKYFYGGLQTLIITILSVIMTTITYYLLLHIFWSDFSEGLAWSKESIHYIAVINYLKVVLIAIAIITMLQAVLHLCIVIKNKITTAQINKAQENVKEYVEKYNNVLEKQNMSGFQKVLFTIAGIMVIVGVILTIIAAVQPVEGQEALGIIIRQIWQVVASLSIATTGFIGLCILAK